MKSYCYEYMFSGCTSLTKAPDLSATTLAGDCYRSMFRNCKSLVNTPVLSGEEIESYCYYEMFYGCELLANNIPSEIPRKKSDNTSQKKKTE